MFGLRARESEALHHVMAGRGQKQAAIAMGISRHTIAVHLDNARHRLRAKNIAHAGAMVAALEYRLENALRGRTG